MNFLLDEGEGNGRPDQVFIYTPIENPVPSGSYKRMDRKCSLLGRNL